MSDKKNNMPYPERFRRHLKTVNQHRFEVMKNCFACGLYKQGLTHDLSKYSPAEFWISVKYFQGWRSPYVYEKELFGFSAGWLHHKGRNRHHWEYWYDMINGEWIPIKMPQKYVIEMVCDRVAACRIYQKEKYTKESALNYYLQKNDRKYMHPDTANLLEMILRRIAEHGEESVFGEIRSHLDEFLHDRFVSF